MRSFPRKNVLLPVKLQRSWSCISWGHVKEFVAYKILSDISHGKNVSVIFSLSFILYLYDLLLLKTLLGSLFCMKPGKKPRIPFCLPKSCQNWFNFSQGLQRFQEKHTCVWKFLHAQCDFVSSTSTWNSLKRVTVRIIPKFRGIRVRTACGFQERQSCLLRGDFNLPLLKG